MNLQCPFFESADKPWELDPFSEQLINLWN